MDPQDPVAVKDSQRQSSTLQPRRLLVGAWAVSLLASGMPVLAQGGNQAGADGGSSPAAAAAANSTTVIENSAGARGAKTYCYMRSEGNTHKVSWDAAYALIKRQNASLFKTSPEHAAVMITEAVVNNPSAYPDCGKYLGNLFAK